MKQLSTLMIAVCLFTAIAPTLKAQVNTQDSLALVDLYDSTGGANWYNNTNWLTSAPVSSWYGITVSGGRVTSVSLCGSERIEFFLDGSIPYSLGNLTKLDSLTLSVNEYLIGSIPSSLGNLTNLKYLNLYHNHLSGSIPSSFGNLANLTYLDLGGNQFSGSIPSSLGNLSNLKTLSFYINNLSDSIPSSLGNLKNLDSIELGQNELSGSIPASLGNLTNLFYLSLGENQLSGSIPSSLGSLTNLLELDLEMNQLNGLIPSSLGNLSKIEYLSLDNNQLSGNIPSSIGNLTNLITLSLNKNGLSGTIPSSIGNLSKIGYLSLEDNQLSGTIPSSLDNLVSLESQTQLFLSNNQFTFAGMEGIVKFSSGSFDGTSYNHYAPQATIPIYFNNNVLSVSVGGTPTNDTYKWYKDNILVATKVGDSTYTPTVKGTYWAVATNAVANQLTLTSNTITITSLPIKSINLQAKETNGQVLLQWQTIDEINTASFTIQHSTDGKTFSDIATKEAVGSGNNGYSFIDKSLAEGINYYRIKAVDKDGAASYSKVVSCELSVVSKQIIVYPNPSKDLATIKGNHIASVQVIDNNGRVVNVITLKDATNPSIKTSDLATRIYYLHIKTIDGNETVTKLIKE